MENISTSIITPVYNAAEYIEITAMSVRKQTYKDFEWIIVNDCSSDNTLEILKNLSREDKRIKVISLDKNGGPITARNAGFKAATGRYIALIDADDIWLPNKLEIQLAAMKENNAGLSCTGYKKINKNGSLRTGITINPPRKITYNKLLFTDSIMASSAVIDTAQTGPVMQSFDAPVGRDDYDLFLKILKDYGNGIGIKKDLARLRISYDSITGNKLKSAKLQWIYYKKNLNMNFLTACQKFIVYAIIGFIKYLF